jgi:PKD repeat protein
MATSVADMTTGWTKYPTYTIYEQAMAQFASNYPALCQIDTILNLASGRRILVAQITSNVGTPANKPQFLYSSSMHGDEITGLIMMLRLTNLLLTSYGTNTRLTNIVNNVDLWICPMANPDGTYYNSSPSGSTVANSRRGNANGIDLNRNYPDPRAGQNPDGNSTQIETQAFMTFAGNHHFNMAANFHGGAELFNFPWDTWASSSRTAADDNWWRYVGNQFADSAQAYGPSGYFTGPGFTNTTGVTEGGDWYVVTGGRQDYMNYWHYCREVCIEISDTKIGASEDLNSYWTTLYRPLLKLVEQSTFGVRGIIKDSCSNNPIRAKVFITAWDKDSSHVYSALPVGNYHRYLKAGTYNLTFSASGYQSKTVTGVVVVDGQATTLNVNLRQTNPVAAFSADVTSTCTGVVNFTNTSSSSATAWNWAFGDGSTSTLQNPTHTFTTSGTFTVKLKVTSCAGKDSLIKTSYISVILPISPAVTNGSRCGAGIVNMSASGSGTLNWYDDPSAGSLVNTGLNYSPTLSNSATYYVESNLTTAPVTTGMTFTGTGGGGTSSGAHYIIFDALSTFTLISVKVNNITSGALTKTIQLQNSAGNVLQQVANVSIPAGTSTVTLNFNVPIQNDLRLVCTSGISLYRNSTGVAFPYNVANMISLKNTDAGTSYYYYFYEWQIQANNACISARVPVTATINNYPVAGFTNVVLSNTVNFTNTSSYASSYLWKFGDGNTSTSANPSHTYYANNTYNVKLIVTNICGSDSITFPVTIITVGVSDITDNKLNVNIYPNPSSGNFNISLFSADGDNCTLLVYNLLGECLYRDYFRLASGKNSRSINLESLSQGLYYLKLEFNNNSFIQKIVIK